MGIGYILVNRSKRELITFAQIPVSKARELSGNAVSSALTTWYLLQNVGDAIAFVSDTYEDWPFITGSRNDLQDFPDVTNRIIDDLIANGILADHGISWADENEPETIYYRDLRNVWSVS